MCTCIVRRVPNPNCGHIAYIKGAGRHLGFILNHCEVKCGSLMCKPFLTMVCVGCDVNHSLEGENLLILIVNALFLSVKHLLCYEREMRTDRMSVRLSPHHIPPCLDWMKQENTALFILKYESLFPLCVCVCVHAV